MFPKFHLLIFSIIAWVSIQCAFAESVQPTTNLTSAQQEVDRKDSTNTGADSTPKASQAKLWPIMRILTLFGAFGGILAALGECSLKEIRQHGIIAFGNKRRLVSCILVGALWGIGGAICFASLAALDGKFKSFEDGDEILLACLAVASGFVGLQMLTLMGRRLSKEVDAAVEKKTEEVKQEIRRDSLVTQEMFEALTTANGALHGNNKSDLRDAIQKLHRVLKSQPTNRTATIYAGRIYRALGELDNATNILQETLETRKKTGNRPNEDDAALLFNIACYLNLKADELDKEGKQEEAKALRTQAGLSIKESCRIDPTNTKVAWIDPDLATLFKGVECDPESF